MDAQLKRQKGSPSRDFFKVFHKHQCPSTFYATDLDFVLVAKGPERIVGILDWKTEGDALTFSEVIAYNAFLEVGFKVFIVEGVMVAKEEKGPEGVVALPIGVTPKRVYRYRGGNYRPDPPKTELELVTQGDIGWKGFKMWENELRKKSLEGK